MDEFTCICCGSVHNYENSHKVEGDGLVCSDCLIECEWDAEVEEES